MPPPRISCLCRHQLLDYTQISYSLLRVLIALPPSLELLRRRLSGDSEFRRGSANERRHLTKRS